MRGDKERDREKGREREKGRVRESAHNAAGSGKGVWETEREE